MSQFQPDHHLRVPLQGAATDPDIQGAVRQCVPPPLRSGGGSDPHITDLDIELFFPEAAGRVGVAIWMEIKATLQGNSRQEALAPGDPNPQEMHVRIAEL